MKMFSFNIHLNSLLLIISLYSFISCSKSPKKANDWQRMNLKEQVLQIDEISYKSYQDFFEKKNGEKSFTRFDKKGLITKNARYMSHGQIYWLKFLYKSDSVWIDEVLEVGNNNEQPQNYWLYKINDLGQQYAVTSYLIDSSVNFHIDLKFNSAGNVTHINYSQQRYPTHVPCQIIKLYDKEGILKEEHSYLYDENTQTCAEKYTRSIITLNKQGDLEREILYYPNGQKEINSYKYIYDEKENWIQKQRFSGDYPEEVFSRALSYFPDSLVN